MAPNKPHPFYSPLDSSLEQIRLLEITTPTPTPSKIRDKWRAVRKRGTGSVPVERYFEPLRKVECRVHTVSLKDKPAFCALSYVWGDPNVTKPIVVEGKRIQVTTNLANALCYLRGHWALENPDLDPSEFRIWADAISINQLDVEERSAQVAIMGRIYNAASQVYAWLGESDPHIEAAVRTYQLISEHAIEGTASRHELYGWMEQYPFLCRKDVDNTNGITGNHTWDALLRFFKTAYWYRIWIFQELVLANKLTFVHATTSIQYVNLKRGCDMISGLAMGASGFYMSIPEWFNDDVWNAIFVDRRYTDWEDPISRDRSVYRSTRSRSRLEDADFILKNGSRLSCSDPRDHVYALLGLTPSLKLKPDYTKSYQDVLRDFVTLLVGKPRPLLFLLWSGVGFQATTSALPSWCPNFEFLSMTEDVETAVFDVGELVPEDFEKSVSEEEEDNAGDTGEQLATLSLQPSLLTVSALPTGKRIKVVHSVLSVETRDGTMKGPLLTFILKFCTRPYPTGIHPIHAFLLTAVLGDDYAFKNRCSSLLHHMGFPNDTLIVKALGVSCHANLEDAAAQVFGLPKPTEDSDKRGRKVALKISWTELVNVFEKRQRYHRLVETDDGFIGLAPRGTVPGDIVRLVRGCVTPLVLRRTETGYLNVGPIYVAGIMKEELFRAIEEAVAAGTLEKLAIV